MNLRFASVSIKFSIYVLWASCAWLFLYFLFFEPHHNRDLDGFLYLGSRLEYNELLFIHDFETKLPFLQYLFYVPYKLGGIGAWRIITLITACSFGAYASFLLANQYFKESNINQSTINQLAIVLTGLFVLTLYYLPGGESSHILMLSAAAAYVALALILNSTATSSAYTVLFSGVFLAFAALIRPNYVYLLPVFTLWIFLFGLSKVALIRRLTLTTLFLFGFLGICFLSILPYVFVHNGIDALTDGLRTLANYPARPANWKLKLQVVTHTDTRVLYSAMYAACAFLVFFAYCDRKDSIWKPTLLAFFSIIALNISLKSTHYWNMHVILFVPIAILIATMSIVVVLQTYSYERQKTYVYVAMLYILILIANPMIYVFDTFKGFGVLHSRFDAMINRRNTDQKLLSFVEAQKKNGLSFIVAENPIYHVLLNESRLGDPVPVMLRHVLRGVKFKPISNIYLFTKEVQQKPCLAVLNSDKDWIITHKTLRRRKNAELIKNCISKYDGVYREVDIAELQNYRFYLKTDVPMSISDL